VRHACPRRRRTGSCRLYGTRGQAQGGIDLYARLGTGHYATYQCKRYEKVIDSDLENAVAKFREGDWLQRSERFVFCTSHPATRTDHVDEIERQTSSATTASSSRSGTPSAFSTPQESAAHRARLLRSPVGRGVFGYIEAFYNRRRRHSTLGLLSPLEFETSTLRTDGASLAASRLASTNKMEYKSTSTAQAA
jgi:transposase InsO family protein